MKIKDYKKEYQWFSARASDISRQLSFAGIAVIWLFRIVDESGSNIPNGLVLPLILFCVSLGSDLLQYIAGTVIWGVRYRYLEYTQTNGGLETDFKHSSWLPVPIYVFYGTKLATIIIAYIVMVSYFIRIIL